MLLKIGVVLFVIQSWSGAGFDWCSLKCNGQKHTMCIYKAGGGDACAAVVKGLTAQEKEVILDYHNKLRAKVANGQEATGPQPAAADMNQLVWDNEVAKIAQRWADQCKEPGGHDQCRITKDQAKVGQNYGDSSGYGMSVDRVTMVTEMIKLWYSEVKDMDPRLVDNLQVVTPTIGHYTQLVWGNTARLGCGLGHRQESKEGEFEFRFVCNYKITGNFIGAPVYAAGEAASKCTKKSTTYPGLCEPQQKGDKLNSDVSVKASSFIYNYFSKSFKSASTSAPSSYSKSFNSSFF